MIGQLVVSVSHGDQSFRSDVEFIPQYDDKLAARFEYRPNRAQREGIPGLIGYLVLQVRQTVAEREGLDIRKLTGTWDESIPGVMVEFTGETPEQPTLFGEVEEEPESS